MEAKSVVPIVGTAQRIIWNEKEGCHVYWMPQWIEAIGEPLLRKVQADLMQFPRDPTPYEDLKNEISKPDGTKFRHFVTKRWGVVMVSKRFIMTVGNPKHSAGYKFSGQTSETISWDNDALLHSSKLLAERLGTLCGFPLDRIHVNLYRGDEDNLSWHQDDETDQRKIIICISFGVPMRLQLKRKEAGDDGDKEKMDLVVKDGTCYVMDGNTQQIYMHCITPLTKELQKGLSPKELQDNNGWRLSLTFRSVISKS